MRRNTIIIAVVLATAVALAWYGLRSTQPAAAQPTGKNDELAKARNEYINGLKKLNYTGRDIVGSYIFSVRWLEADLEAANNKEQRITAYAAHLKRMINCEKDFESNTKFQSREEALEISSLRTVIQPEARYWLTREKLRK